MVVPGPCGTALATLDELPALEVCKVVCANAHGNQPATPKAMLASKAVDFMINLFCEEKNDGSQAP